MERFVPRLGGLTKAEGLALISDAYPKLILPFIGAAGMLTARWYSEQKALPRSTGFAVEPAALPADEKLAASGRWALVQRDPVGALQGTASRSLFDQSRDTVLDNAGREGVRWARYASANACGFCRMLATRSLTAGEAGAPGLYRSERAALGSPHKKNARGHDHCKCLAVPVRSGTYEPPAYVHDWLDDYNAVSRDDNGVLLPEWQIAARMERRADERMGRTRPKPGRPRKEKPQPDFDRLAIEAAPEPEKPAPKRVVKHLTKKSEQVDAAVKPLRDRVETAQRIANRADEVVNTAAGISSKVKQVTDVADKVLGGAVPIVRDVKTVVDTADKALQTAAQVTSGVSKVADAAATVVDSTVDIAHGVKQIADEVVSVLDDATAVALGVRALLADTGQAVRSTAGDLRNVRSVADLADTIGDAVDTARRVHSDTAALVEDARGVVEATKGITEGIQELPLVLQKPIADVQELAQTVRDAVDDVDQFGDDAAALARAVKRLVDAVADWRRVEAATDEPRPPVFVRSERLDTPRAIGPAPKAIEAGGSDRLPAVRPPAEEPRQTVYVRSERLDAPRAIGPAPKAIEAGGGSDRLPAVRPRAAVEAVTQPAGRPVFVRSERLDLPKAIEPKAGERAALPAGAEPKAIEAARTPALPAAAERKALEAPRRPVVDEEALERQRVLDWLDAEDEHNHAVAYWQRVDDELAKPFGGEPEVKPKPAASAAKRPRKPKRTLDDVERDMNAALEAGDDALVDKLAAEMERIERREQAAAERAAAKAAERAAARQAKADAAEAELRAKHDRIFELIEAGEDPDVAEAEVMGESLDTVRRRNFMRAAQAEGHHGNTFTKVLKQKYYQLANEAYQAAEDATNGNMLKAKFEGKVDPASLWSMSDRDARKYMSEEMAAWFDENGRLTFMAYRQAVLDGRGNWRNPLTEDYLQ
ncbi:MuF-like minor capsid protein [Mycobacterium phage InvictusManeo]|uniref:MuF-like minor capsid protein n=1 Tax=Mycobacterium phage Larva TaxID=2922990 RepID=G1FMR0_9CAUD|nr:head maturation protease [Mycobacterium phage Larva]AEL19663.1 MuF-like minor capsid protein [Mycobacterium phage Larva]UEM46402.1 MuF-like minor capsid protein [Mycobacterium phage InvictusManeo]